MLRDFRDFVARGNVMELAMAVVIGAAFAAVVQSFVTDVLMPPIGLLTGGVDFSELYVNLGPAEYASLAEARAAGAPTINYGIFLNSVVAFLIVAFAVFVLARQYDRLRSRSAPPAAAGPECPYCRLSIAIGATRCPHCTSDLPA